MDLFGGCCLIFVCVCVCVGKKASFPKISDTSYSDETWQSYTLPKEDPKTYKSCDTAFEFGNQQFLLYQEIKMEIAF